MSLNMGDLAKQLRSQETVLYLTQASEEDCDEKED